MIPQAKLLPFPHFSISSFLISSFPVPAFRPTRYKAIPETYHSFVAFGIVTRASHS